MLRHIKISFPHLSNSGNIQYLLFQVCSVSKIIPQIVIKELTPFIRIIL